MEPEVLALAEAVALLARAPAREREALFAQLPEPDERLRGWVDMAAALVERPFDHTLFAALAEALANAGLLEDALFAVDRAIELAEPSADYQVARGDLLVGLERLMEATPAFRAALAADPGHAGAHLRMAVAECRVGRDEAGRVHLERAVERDPGLAIAWLNLARLDERRGALDAAQAALAKFRALAPADPRGAVVEVSLLLARGDRTGALALGTVELSQLGATPDLMVNTGLAALELGREADAGVLFQRALAADPAHVAALVGAGVLERRRGADQESIRYFEKALDVEPGCAEALLNLGLARARQGRHGEARALLDRALARDPALAGARLARAELVADDELELALADLEQACALAPLDARAWANRAALELAHGRAETAAASATRALELAPKLSEALITLARALEGTGDLVGAETAWREALPADADAGLGLADLYERTGRAERVSGLLADARALHPGAWELALAASRAARQAGAHGEAIAHALAALAVVPDEPDAVLAHARALFASGQHQQARARVDLFAQAHPEDARAHLVRGQVLVGLLAYADALDALATALELDATLDEARPLVVAALVGLDRTAEALAEARAGVARDHARPAAHLALAVAAERAGDVAESTRALERAVALDPRDPALAAAHVRLLVGQGRHTEALAAFGALMPGADRDPRVLRAAGEAAFRTGAFADAARHFARALARSPSGADATELAVNEALALANAGDESAALERLTRRGLTEGDAALAALALAARVVADTEPERACGYLERLVELAPDGVVERIELAGCYLARERPAEALAVLDHPGVADDLRGLYLRALALDRARGPRAAAPLYEEVAESWPEALLNLGLVHRRLGDHAGELACYAEALERGVPDALAGVLAGQALALRGRPRRALETLVDAGGAPGLAGSLAALRGDARAVPLLADALLLRPGDPDLTHNLAFAYLFADRASDGLELFADVPPAHTGADWLLRAALTEAVHGADDARTLVHEALVRGGLAPADRFLVQVAVGNLAADPEAALRAYLTAAGLCERLPRYLLTSLGALLTGPRDYLETLRALARVAGHDTAALAVAARAATGARRVDNRELLWILRSEVGLKFPVHWLLPW